MHGVKFLFQHEETHFNLNHGLFSKLTLVFQADPALQGKIIIMR